MVTAGTIEERIQALKASKKDLFDKLIGGLGGDFDLSQHFTSLRGLVQLENTLSMIRENLNPEVQIQGILPTMYDKRTLHSREAIDILEENFGDLVFDTKIRKTIRYAEAR